jgi:hypothetical protein
LREYLTINQTRTDSDGENDLPRVCLAFRRCEFRIISRHAAFDAATVFGVAYVGPIGEETLALLSLAAELGQNMHDMIRSEPLAQAA